jgi:hypothetical protein
LLGLGWIDSQRPYFGLGPDVSWRFDKRDVAKLKPISELALTLDVLDRCGICLPALNNLAEWIWDEIDKGRLLTSLLLARPDFVPCCSLVASMAQLGYRRDALATVLKMVAALDMTSVLPLPPWARLALRYNLGRLGLTQPQSVSDLQLYVLSRPEPWIMSAEIAYAITHEVFYLTDFGFVSLDAPTISYLKCWLPYWARAFLDECNDDVLGEFAMCWTTVAEWPECFTDGPLPTVLSHQRDDGAVPGPPGAGTVLTASDDSPERREFLATYHTTLVAIMACALTLRRERLARANHNPPDVAPRETSHAD